MSRAGHAERGRGGRGRGSWGGRGRGRGNAPPREVAEGDVLLLCNWPIRKADLSYYAPTDYKDGERLWRIGVVYNRVKWFINVLNVTTRSQTGREFDALPQSELNMLIPISQRAPFWIDHTDPWAPSLQTTGSWISNLSYVKLHDPAQYDISNPKCFKFTIQDRLSAHSLTTLRELMATLVLRMPLQQFTHTPPDDAVGGLFDDYTDDAVAVAVAVGDHKDGKDAAAPVVAADAASASAAAPASAAAAAAAAGSSATKPVLTAAGACKESSTPSARDQPPPDGGPPSGGANKGAAAAASLQSVAKGSGRAGGGSGVGSGGSAKGGRKAADRSSDDDDDNGRPERESERFIFISDTTLRDYPSVHVAIALIDNFAAVNAGQSGVICRESDLFDEYPSIGSVVALAPNCLYRPPPTSMSQRPQIVLRSAPRINVNHVVQSGGPSPPVPTLQMLMAPAAATAAAGDRVDPYDLMLPFTDPKMLSAAAAARTAAISRFSQFVPNL